LLVKDNDKSTHTEYNTQLMKRVQEGNLPGLLRRVQEGKLSDLMNSCNVDCIAMGIIQ
jgi:hypothetical protein